MIRAILRQEREGGWWFVRDEGRAVRLDANEFRERAAATDGDERVRRVFHDPSTLPLDADAAPKRIYFELTRRCNLRCRTCFNESGPALDDELTFEEVVDINLQAAELGVFEIRYTGGECAMLERFCDIVADARSRGLYVSVGTNGVWDDAQLAMVPSCGVDWFIVSLDGDRETNDRIRGRGTYDRVLRTIALLSRTNVRIRLNVTVARHNVHALETLARIADERGIESINLIPLRPYGRSTRMPEVRFDRRDFHAFVAEVNRLRRAFPRVAFSTTIDLLDPEETTSHDRVVRKAATCAAGVEACVIGPRGHVYGCSYSPASFVERAGDEARRLFIAGNIRDDDLCTIWRDSSRWQLFRDLDRFKHPKCRACVHYARRCSGSCQIMAWAEREHAGTPLAQVADPYCFADLLEGTT